mgnify:FL=1
MSLENFMVKNSKILFILLLTFLFTGILPVNAEATNLYFSPASGVFNKGENFTVGIYIDAENPINAIQSSVVFPTEYLEVIKTENNNNSIIDLWVHRPSFSNIGISGNVRFEGVVLSPGFSGVKGKIADIVFRVRKQGTASLDFSEFSVLANDGLGTSLSVSRNQADFVLGAASIQTVNNKQTINKEDIKIIEEKVKAVVESQMKNLDSRIPYRATGENSDSLIAVWGTLPSWFRISISIFVGLASILLALIFLGFAIIVLIWCWSFIGKHHKEFFDKILFFIKRFKKWLKREEKNIEKEISEDIKYSTARIREEVRESRDDDSIKEVLRDYWILVGKILKRFFTRNR